MKQFLLLQLYGPLAAWGDIAVGEKRPSSSHPGKSAIIGLLAAAKGIRRDKEEMQLAMERGYGIGVLAISTGTYISDYHTTQVPPQVAIKKHHVFTRRDELNALTLYQKINPKKSGTILSNREYRCDTSYQIAIWDKINAPYPLNDLKECMTCPNFTIYLGRKSCPLGLPVQAHIVEADTIADAFRKAEFKTLQHFINILGANKRNIPAAARIPMYWEDGAKSGLKIRETYIRRDRIISRRRWQFDERPEHHAVWNQEV